MKEEMDDKLLKVCCRAGDETGKLKMEDRKENKDYQPDSQAGMVGRSPGRVPPGAGR